MSTLPAEFSSADGQNGCDDSFNWIDPRLTASNALVKRTMAEIKAESLGITEPRKLGRNTLYALLRSHGYNWSPKYQIWLA